MASLKRATGFGGTTVVETERNAGGTLDMGFSPMGRKPRTPTSRLREIGTCESPAIGGLVPKAGLFRERSTARERRTWKDGTQQRALHNARRCRG
jgi:hypothetical protein